MTVSTPVRITYNQAIESIRRAVALRGPGFVYEPFDTEDNLVGVHDTCAYFRDGNPDCLVGHVLADVGLTESDLDESNCNTDADVSQLIESDVIEVDEKTKTLLTVTQSHQDKNDPWGKAAETGVVAAEQVQV